MWACWGGWGMEASAIPFLALLGLGGLFPVVASETSFIHRRWDAWAFDFEERTRLALSEESRAERFLKPDVRLVEMIVFRGCHAHVLPAPQDAALPHLATRFTSESFIGLERRRRGVYGPEEI